MGVSTNLKIELASELAYVRSPLVEFGEATSLPQVASLSHTRETPSSTVHAAGLQELGRQNPEDVAGCTQAWVARDGVVIPSMDKLVAVFGPAKRTSKENEQREI